jgi:hypothetical protein
VDADEGVGTAVEAEGEGAGEESSSWSQLSNEKGEDMVVDDLRRLEREQAGEEREQTGSSGFVRRRTP